MKTAEWIVLDLETGDAAMEAVARKMQDWRPPSNLKDPEKIAARRKEAAEKALEKAALLDESPILCVGMQTDSARFLLNGMDGSAPEIDGWPVMPCTDERGLLVALRAVLDRIGTPETILVGHNVRAFDLPKLRHAYIRQGLRMPEILKPRLKDEERAEVVDTSRLFKAFSMEHRDDFCPSLDDLAASFGLPRPKEHMSGADCPRLYREGEFQTVLTYCAVDVATTARAFALMTGNTPDLE